MTIENPTLSIAERVCPINYSDLNKDTIAMVKRLVADGVAVAMPILPIASLRWRGNGDDVAADGDCVAIAMVMPMLPMAR